MLRRDDDTLLRDMLDHARLAVGAAGGHCRGDLDSDPVLRAALERFVEVIGEAANRVSESRRLDLPRTPWNDMVGMRNRLVHGYAEVDRDVIWATVTVDLPLLITELENALQAQ